MTKIRIDLGEEMRRSLSASPLNFGTGKMVSVWFWICFTLFSVSVVPTTQQSTCQDLDTTACVLLHKQKPDLCADPAFSGTACKRFCGKCPLVCYNCPSPVRDPNNCQTTTACAANQTCMTKHFKATDGHHEYILTCEPDTLCSGFGFGFSAVGKRDSDSKSIQNRDISIECCDTDMCNFPTSTTVATTTTTPMTTIKYVHGCSKDIIFVLDDSGSIGTSNFAHAIDFVRTIISSLDIGPHNSQVGLLVFGTHPQSVWHLNSHTTKAELITASGHLHYYGGATRTYEALDYVRTTMLTSAHGDRSTVPNVVIVITDGRSTDRAATSHSAQLLHQLSTDVIGIEIGNTNEQEILTIATDKNHVFDLQHYSSILTIVPNIISLICPAYP